jgi:hypothetical protein
VIEAGVIITMGVITRGRTAELSLANIIGIVHLLACLCGWKFPGCRINYLTLGQLAS